MLKTNQYSRCTTPIHTFPISVVRTVQIPRGKRMLRTDTNVSNIFRLQHKHFFEQPPGTCHSKPKEPRRKARDQRISNESNPLLRSCYFMPPKSAEWRTCLFLCMPWLRLLWGPEARCEKSPFFFSACIWETHQSNVGVTVRRPTVTCIYAYAMYICMSVCLYVYLYSACLYVLACLHMSAYVCICLHVCMSVHVWMSVCLYVWMSVCLNVRMSECVYVCMSVSMSLCLYAVRLYACMPVCLYAVRLYACTPVRLYACMPVCRMPVRLYGSLCMSVCMHVCMSACLYVCMSVCT